jgi:rod shape-determining protein MreC
MHQANSSVQRILQNYTIATIEPIQNCITYLSKIYRSQIDDIESLIQAKRENVALKEQLITLQSTLLESKILAQENAALKSQLNYIADKGIKFKTAKMIAGVYNKSLSEAFINAGYKDGITDNALVFNKDGALGRIISINNNNSKVLLLNDRRSYIPAKSLNTGNKMIISGIGKDMLEIKFLAENKEPIEGEVLLTSSEANLIPENIPLGKIIKKAGGGYQVAPFANLNNLDIVHIYINE